MIALNLDSLQSIAHRRSRSADRSRQKSGLLVKASVQEKAPAGKRQQA